MILIEKALHHWKAQPIDPRYMVASSPITASPQNYFTDGVVARVDPHPEKINFNADLTPYAVILRTNHKNSALDAALAGFHLNSGVAECIQIQGRHRGYGVLSPLQWDRELLRALTFVARNANLDAVTVLAAHSIPGCDEHNIERLLKRYDENARSHGFRLSSAESKYVLELK